MSFKNLFYMFVLSSVSLLFSSCGGSGGGGSTNATMTIALSSATIGAGKSVTATVTVASPTGKSLSNLTPTLVSDSPDVVPVVTDTNGTNAAGVTNITLRTRNIKSTVSVVKIYATLDGITSSVATLTVNPPTLALNPPADFIFSVASTETPTGSGVFTCGGGQVRVVTTGAQAVFKDSSLQNVQGQSIVISVLSITNQALSGLDQVVFFPDQANQVIIPPYNVTVALTTDTNGTAVLPLRVDGEFPIGKGGNHVFTVNWIATTQIVGDNGLPIIFTIQKQTMYTNSCT